MIELTPVKSAKLPAYPTKAAALGDPQLLKELPGRWNQCKKAAMAAGLAASLTFAFTSCVFPGANLPASIISEEEALQTIKKTAGNDLTGLSAGAAKDMQKPLIYLEYDQEKQEFQETLPEGDPGLITIDAFSGEKNAGFEYYYDEFDNYESNPDFLSNDKAVEHADKNNAYVLVIDGTPVDDNQAIEKQVGAFISWLKAEGIL